MVKKHVEPRRRGFRQHDGLQEQLGVRWYEHGSRVYGIEQTRATSRKSHHRSRDGDRMVQMNDIQLHRGGPPNVMRDMSDGFTDSHRRPQLCNLRHTTAPSDCTPDVRMALDSEHVPRHQARWRRRSGSWAICQWQSRREPRSWHRTELACDGRSRLYDTDRVTRSQIFESRPVDLPKERSFRSQWVDRRQC